MYFSKIVNIFDVFTHNIVMIACTICLVVLVVMFIPLNIDICITIYPSTKRIVLTARLCSVKCIKETIYLNNKLLQFNGSFTGNVSIDEIKKDNSSVILKSLTIVEIYVVFCNNINCLEPLVVTLEQLICSIGCGTFCAISNTRIFCKTCFVQNESQLTTLIHIKTNLAELSYSFIKQGVILWRTRKLDK